MAIQYEVTKKLRGPTTIRTVGIGTANIQIQSQVQSTGETLTDITIKRCAWSTNGNILITKGPDPLLELHGQGQIDFDSDFSAIANNSNNCLYVTVATGGSVVLEVGKVATYTPPLINSSE
tara:strand:+ start:339 stop:701 length:363 start_codon:yes stop_codon:yes gene_type:complete